MEAKMAKTNAARETHAYFKEWLAENALKIPLVRWGNQHTEIACLFAEACSQRATRRLLDEALNSGDGSYKP